MHPPFGLGVTMTRKEATTLLDSHLPGWAKLDNPSHAIKRQVAPRHRAACTRAHTIIQTTPKPKPKAKAKAKAKRPKEG